MYSFKLGAGRRLGIVALAFTMMGGAWDQNIACGANATLIDEDPNVDGLGFGRTDPFVFGAAYSQDATAAFNGNEFLVQTQNGISGNTGAGMSMPVSNGENGLNSSDDGGVLNPDVPNATPPNSVFATIGNASGKLENGNVVRYSMWVRSDPANPITAAPQIEPVLKFEFWKEALSTNQDTNGGQPQPFFGDKVVDSDQHLNNGIWIDLDNSGTVIDGNAAAQGRIRTVTTAAWTLIETTQVIDDSLWLGIADDVYTVAQIEEVRGVMFWGDFANTDLTNAGSLWFDNVLMEVFKNQAAVTPNANPRPGPAGDFDNDGDVDNTDYGLWRTALGSTAGADADFDLDSDGLDFLRWQRNFGRVPEPPAVGAAGGVPEPGAAALSVVGLGLLAAGRRSRRV